VNSVLSVMCTLSAVASWLARLSSAATVALYRFLGCKNNVQPGPIPIASIRYVSVLYMVTKSGFSFLVIIFMI